MINILCIFCAAFLGAIAGNFAAAIYCGKIIKKIPVPNEIVNVWYED